MGTIEIVKLLIDNGADVQVDDNVALRLRCKRRAHGDCQTINCQRSRCSS